MFDDIIQKPRLLKATWKLEILEEMNCCWSEEVVKEIQEILTQEMKNEARNEM